MKMAPPKPLLLAISLPLLLLQLVSPASCSFELPSPVLAFVTKDPTTSLYTTTITPGGAKLLVDLAGPLVWSTCDGGGRSPPLSCQDPACKLSNAYHPPACRKQARHHRCHHGQCKAYPYNPFTRQCAAGELSRTPFAASTIDAKNNDAVSPVSFNIVTSCAPRELLASPPATSGVAGLSASGLALPAQAAAGRKARNAFFLCLPSTGRGAALLGAGAVAVLPTELQPLASTTGYSPLLSKRGDPAYYLPVKGVAVSQAAVALPAKALAGGVVLSTLAPYTELRPDVYRALVEAFDAAMGRDAMVSVPPGKPFELCYNSSALVSTKIGYQVPYIDLMLAGGRNWTVLGSNSMVNVDDNTACFAFVEMKKQRGAPAVVIGGFQMENNLLSFDLEKKRLGFAVLPFYLTSCSRLSFTQTS